MYIYIYIYIYTEGAMIRTSDHSITNYSTLPTELFNLLSYTVKWCYHLHYIAQQMAVSPMLRNSKPKILHTMFFLRVEKTSSAFISDSPCGNIPSWTSAMRLYIKNMPLSLKIIIVNKTLQEMAYSDCVNAEHYIDSWWCLLLWEKKVIC